VYLRNERRCVACEEPLDAGERGDEGAREFGIARFADDNQQGDTMQDDGRKLIRLVADASVVCDGDPTLPAHNVQPFLVRTRRREVIRVDLHGEPGRAKNFRELLAEIPVREENTAQAARS
jgi:hypothetical protein